MKTIAPLLALAFVAACDDDDASPDAAVVVDAGDPDADIDAAAPDADIDAAPPDADIDAGPPPFGPPADGNNNATLTGVTVGAGTTDVSLLRKEIAVEGKLSHAGLVAGPAYATRQYADPGAATYGMIRVANQGDVRQCFIDANNFLLLDAQDAVLVGDGFTIFNGTVGRDGFSTLTCLAPGEIGYLIFIDQPEWDRLAKVRFDLSASAGNWGEPGTSLRPTQASSTTSGFQVRIENQGPLTASIGGYSRYALFDGQGLPLSWGFVDECTPIETLAPGAAFDGCGSSYYDGQSDVIHTWVDFDVTDTTKLAAPNPREELFRARTHELARRARAAR